MLTRDQFKGLFVLLVTPVNKKMRVDYDAHAENIRRLVNLGVDGIVLYPSWNGEVHVSTAWERERMLQIAVAQCRGKVRCVADCSALSTTETVRRARRAVELGADGVISMVPYGVPLSNAEMLQYWRDLAAGVPDAGVIAYNRRGDTHMSDEDFVALADVPNFLGSKMSGGLPEYTSLIKNTPQKHWALEAIWAVTKSLGGDTVAAAWIYACPSYMMRWWRAICNNDVATATRMQDEVKDLLQAIVVAPMRAGYSEPAALKAFIEALGHFRCGPPRKPSFAMSEEELAHIRHQVEERFPQFLS